MTKLNPDILFIGGGTGGLKGAIAAAKAGASVVVAEPGALGGTCLNVGCIPTKAMLQASEHFHSLSTLNEFGITVSKPKINFKQLMKRVTGIIQEGQSHLESVPKIKNLTLLRKKATFVSDTQVKIGTTTYKPKYIVIGTGATNFIPPIPGINDCNYLNNENIFSLQKLPKSLITIGGGYIAMEFATFFSQLGVKVTVVERLPSIIPQISSEFTSALQQKYETDAMTFYTNANILATKQSKSGFSVTFNDVREPNSKSKTIKAEQLLLATGRVPNTKQLGLEQTTINVTKRGAISVNAVSQTAVKHIYAIGDCTGQTMFAHSAKREMRIALDHILYGESEKYNPTLVPWAVFTDPPISGIGYSESELKAKKIKYDSLTIPFKKAGRTRVMGKQFGMATILFNAKTDRILGATIMGERADELIHEIGALLNKKATLSDLHTIIHVHPTVSELFENV